MTEKRSWIDLFEKIYRLFFPKGQGHVRLAVAIVGAAAVTLGGPPLAVLIGAAVCGTSASASQGICNALLTISSPPIWVGVGLIFLAVLVFFLGALLPKQPPDPVADDFLSLGLGELTIGSALNIVRTRKNVAISLKNMSPDEIDRPLQDIEISGDGPEEVIGLILSSVNGGAPVGVTYWFEQGQYFVGRKDPSAKLRFRHLRMAELSFVQKGVCPL